MDVGSSFISYEYGGFEYDRRNIGERNIVM